MESELIEQVADVPSAKSLGQSKVKNAKKIASTVKMCVYFKDMECRIPLCDLEVCQKCQEGCVYCTRVEFIRKMLSKVLILLLGFLILFEI